MPDLTTNLAINESLTEMSESLSTDLQMLRNYRADLVKKQQFERIDLLKNVEQKIEALIAATTAALR